MTRWGRWPKYISAADRRVNAARHSRKLHKDGTVLAPVVVSGRSIASTFWGKAWCKNLESFSDFDNRLPRGRTYVRNGLVIHLEINQGEIMAQVYGSSLYNVRIQITPLRPDKWQNLVKACAGDIGSVVELLQGQFSKSVMEILTKPSEGLFPEVGEMSLFCSCPDWAQICKHVAATFYGVGARLDEQPELLFKLRHVDHMELLASASTGFSEATEVSMDSEELSALFGVEIDDGAKLAPKKPAMITTKKRTVAKKIDCSL